MDDSYQIYLSQSLFSVIYPNNISQRLSYYHQQLMKGQDELMSKYYQDRTEIVDDLRKMKEKRIRTAHLGKIEEQLILNSSEESVHKFSGDLMQERVDKEKRARAIQSNIDEYDMALDRYLDSKDGQVGLPEVEDKSWITLPVHTVMIMILSIIINTRTEVVRTSYNILRTTITIVIIIVIVFHLFLLLLLLN